MSEIPANRLASLDALRGLDLLVIIGLDALMQGVAMLYYKDSAFWYETWLQFGHAPWEGLRIYDVVFPLFVFISGVAMSFSLARSGGGDNRGRRIGRLWCRAAYLVFLGWLINGPITWDLTTMRYASVLGLIGISGALAGTLALWFPRWTARLAIAVVLLGIVGIAQYFGGDMTPAGCVNAKIDQACCPGVLHSKTYDPEGPLCLVSGTVLCLAGVMAGSLLMTADNAMKRLLKLSVAGVLLIGLSLFTGPVIKGIWTPAFVLACAGISLLLFAIFHFIVDVLGLRAWTFPLRVVGLNAIFIYLVTHIIDFRGLTERVFCGTLHFCCPADLYQVFLSAFVLLLGWLICFALYRHRIFFKI